MILCFMLRTPCQHVWLWTPQTGPNVILLHLVQDSCGRWKTVETWNHCLLIYKFWNVLYLVKCHNAFVTSTIPLLQKTAHLKQQYTCIDFSFKLGQTAIDVCETSALPLKEETIRRHQCLFLFSKLESGVVSVVDAVYSGKLPSSTTYGNVAQIMELCSKGAYCEPPILCKSSNTSTGRCADTATWEVVPWELVSPPWQLSCSLLGQCRNFCQMMARFCHSLILHTPQIQHHVSISFPRMEVGTQERGILIHQHDIRNAGYICTVQNTDYY